MSTKFFDPVGRATKLSTALNHDLTKPIAVSGEARYADVFRSIQYESTLKKVEAQGDSEALEKEAFISFLARNHKLAEYNRLLANNRQCDDSSVLGYVLRRARHIIRWVLGDITTEEVFDACRHSGGVTQGVPFMDTSLNRKSSFPMSATLRASEVMTEYMRYDTMYLSACLQVTLKGVKHPNLLWSIIEGSRATTVPKTAKARRMIAVEPTANMYLQQGLMVILYNRLRECGLDVTTLPDRHRDLAYYASVSGFLATIDLSNASDTVSLELVRSLFPPKWFKWLNDVRSPVMSVNGQTVRLESYATMGNATTFPVETLVFWAIGVACVMLCRHKKHFGIQPWKYTSLLSLPSDRRVVSVFGDDIIIPVEAVPDLFYCLGQLGLSINYDKSFFDKGRSFRESCGGDFYHGRAVRPWFIRGPTTEDRRGQEAWFYVLANTLLKRYYSYFGGVGYLYEKQALRLILSWLMEVTPLVKVVPSSFPDDSGLKGLEGLRLARTYCPEKSISQIGRSEQGWFNFRYLRFRYFKETKITQELEYAIFLKKRARGDQVPWRWSDYLFDTTTVMQTPIRKKGGYIEARGISISF